MKPIEVDVWVRGTLQATTHTIASVPSASDGWTEGDVQQLLSEMLRALDREKNPGRETPTVTLRGFSWIVSPCESGGVLVHLEMQIGTASAGPFQIAEEQLTTLIRRAMEGPAPSPSVH